MNIAKKYIRASLWAAGIRYIFLVLNFGGQIVLARLLIPEYFGVIVLAMSIIAIFNLFLSFSINMGYVYLPDSKTLFSSSLILALVSWLILMFIVIFALIPLQIYYDEKIAFFVLLIAGFKIFGSIASIQLVQLEKKVDFKYSSLFSGIGGSLALVVSIVAAFNGFNEYSLLLREVMTPLLVFLLIRFYSHQRLDFKSYDKAEVKELFQYSVKMIFSRGSEQLYTRLPFIIIATYFDKNILGYISQMYYLANLLNTSMSTFNAKVAFVFFSQFKNDNKKAKKGLLYINSLNLLLGLPVFIAFYFFPAEILSFLWGDQWVAGANYLQMFSPFALFLPSFNSLKTFFYGHGKNEIVTFAYIGGLIIYLFLITAWPLNSMLPLGFSISLVLMLLYMLIRIFK